MEELYSVAEMKAIYLVLVFAVGSALGNTLPPCPENTLPPCPEMGYVVR